MKSKLITSIILSVFFVLLISNVSAITVDAEWENGLREIEITKGELISFTPEIFSLNLPMTISMKLYDSGDNLVYPIEDGMKVYEDSFTGQYSINQHIYGNSGEFKLVIIGSDGAPSTRTQTLSLKVNEVSVPINHAPVITSNPITKVNEGEEYSYQVVATDENGDDLSYSLDIRPTWVSINGNGLISGTAPSTNENRTYTIIVKVSDGTEVVNQQYSLELKDVPEGEPTDGNGDNDSGDGSNSDSDENGGNNSSTKNPAEIISVNVRLTDFNKDGIVDEKDFELFGEAFNSIEGEDNYNIIYDLNQDGKINFVDYLIFIKNFGKKYSISDDKKSSRDDSRVNFFVTDDYYNQKYESQFDPIYLDDEQVSEDEASDNLTGLVIALSIILFIILVVVIVLIVQRL